MQHDSYPFPPVTAPLALLIFGGLAVSEAVQLEVLKTIGIVITSVASCFAVFQGHRHSRDTSRIEDKIDRDRKAVRELPTGDVVVVEERRRDGREGAARANSHS